MKLQIILLLAVSVISFIGGNLYKSSQPQNSIQINKVTELVTEINKFENEFLKISKEELAEYSNLKDQKDKYNKANDILQKIVKIFILDLGLHLSNQKNDYLSYVDPQSSAQKKESEITNAEAGGKEEESLVTGQSEKPKVSGLKSKTAQWKNNEAKVDQITTEKEAKKFLESVRLNDFFNEAKAAKPINEKQLGLISGAFWGKLNLENEKQEVWDVEIELEAEGEQGKFSGNYTLKLSKDGKAFSTTNGKGGLKHYSSISGSKKSIIISLNGGDGYLQIYSPPKMRALIGNYYHKKGIGDFRHSGTAWLERK